MKPNRENKPEYYTKKKIVQDKAQTRRELKNEFYKPDTINE